MVCWQLWRLRVVWGLMATLSRPASYSETWTAAIVTPWLSPAALWKG